MVLNAIELQYIIIKISNKYFILIVVRAALRVLRSTYYFDFDLTVQSVQPADDGFNRGI